MDKIVKNIIILIICLLLIGLAIYLILSKNNEKVEEISSISTDDTFIAKLITPCANAGYETILSVEVDEQTEIEEIVEVTGTNRSSTSTQRTSKEIPYYIKVNYVQNVVTVYGKDENGNYTKPVKAMLCSTGSATPTSGTYSISSKYTWLPLFGGVYGQYSTRIVDHILFHSVPYQVKGDKGSLEYWEYDKLGTSASAGCIRLTVQDAKWIYNNCISGTKVEFYADSNPGPLGKPTAQKISSEVEVRNWDPTDPDSNNPWKTYKKEEASTSNTVKNEINNNAITNNTNNNVNNIVNNNTTNNTDKNIISNTVTNTINTDKNNTTSSNNTINNIISNTVNNNSNTVTNNVIKNENESSTINNINKNIINNI